MWVFVSSSSDDIAVDIIDSAKLHNLQLNKILRVKIVAQCWKLNAQHSETKKKEREGNLHLFNGNCE